MPPMTPIAVEVALEVAAELLAASLASAKPRCGVLLLVVVHQEGQSHSECFLQLPREKATEYRPWCLEEAPEDPAGVRR